MESNEQDESSAWDRLVQCQPSIRRTEPYNFVEINRLPKKIDAKALTSLVVSASKLIPKATEVCIRTDGFGSSEQVGVVEFNSERDAFWAIERIRASPYGKYWNMKIMGNPKKADPEAELYKKWLN